MDRGRRGQAYRSVRIIEDRLTALTLASAAWRLGQGPSGEANQERTVLGLLRVAHRSGASVADLAAATGRPRAWVRANVPGARDGRGR